MKLISMCCTGLLLCVGCDSKHAALMQDIANIRSANSVKSQPLAKRPQWPDVPKFNYAAQDLRSPFIPSSLAEQITSQRHRRKGGYPVRTAQGLAQFAVEHLQFKGVMHSQDAGFVGLIQTPTGRIEQVRVGEYIGMSQGKIVHMSATKIDLIERISDGQRGEGMRRRSMLLLP